MLSWEFCEICKNTFSAEHHRETASVYSSINNSEERIGKRNCKLWYKSYSLCTNHSQKCKLSKKGSPGEIWTGFRSSSSQIFFKIVVLKNFANSTGKHMYWRHFLIKLQFWKLFQKGISTLVFSSEICNIFKNTFFNSSSGCFWRLTPIFRELWKENRCDCQW